MKLRILTPVIAVVSGIYLAVPAYAQGYHKATSFEQAKAYCGLFADGAQRGHFVFGSPAFVGGAIIGGAIRNAIDHSKQRMHDTEGVCTE
jgi:hypothetical protein